jgi:hypothetical protein
MKTLEEINDEFIEQVNRLNNDDNTFTVNFRRGEQECEPTGTFSSLEQAIKFAKKEAADYAFHPDFRGGFFDVWEHGTPDSFFGEDHFQHDSIFVRDSI